MFNLFIFILSLEGEHFISNLKGGNVAELKRLQMQQLYEDFKAHSSDFDHKTKFCFLIY